ncbi:kinase-like domain-containing protein [Multifurca ochricompacta]|uniref:Kinase-like domain-containing protein n=1 Tax=Multifurca ochricompacta TaxID=376703 RepID=A0AAD4M8C9_9AGAM|nr:kinase-like domain-containing protein [Multifurca ochricompacta]
MPQGSSKRVASTPPTGAGARPTKRQERSSSPEEGELDDADPPQPSHLPSPRLPSAPDTPTLNSRYAVKVKLPFKTKANLPTDIGSRAILPNNSKGPLVPANPERYSGPTDRPQVDGWGSSMESGRSRENGQMPSKNRKTRSYNNERSHPDLDLRDRRWDRPPSGSPDVDYIRPGRSRIRARSHSRSSARSSSNSRSSSRKQTHRLPPHRSARGSLSPLHARRHDRTPDSRDLRDRLDSYPRSQYDSANNWRHDGRGQYRRDPPDNYYIGNYYDSPGPPHRDYDRDHHERASYGSRYESTHGRAVANNYRPIPPPPTPPQSEPQVRHPTVTIFLPKKPAPPAVPRSPPSMSLPPTRSPDGERAHENEANAYEKATLNPEYKAYGRTFVGSGQHDDYDAMTKLGEGTFGEVHKAKHCPTGKLVALKRILMHNEKEGMPVTALREIKILKALKHPNVVELLDMFVVRSNGKDKPLSVYMVFPYMDHDLAGLLENERVKLQPSQIKLYMKQLLEGTEYMHRNHILHRDMKAANLLISNSGSLRIADFGLARSYDPSAAAVGANCASSRNKERRYTNCVVTRWYRPPELLLGARNYGGEIDMWGVGCVLGEMFLRHPILPGNSDLDQLEKIWQMCGTPNQHTWPNFDTLPGCEGVKHHNQHPKRLKSVFEQFGVETCDLIDRLLTCNPGERITASQALEHDYFWTDPLPADPKTLPAYEASHEFDRRGRRQQPPHAPIVPPYAAEPPRLPPPPTINNLPIYFSRGPPARDSFRAPPVPPPTRSQIPPSSGHHYPQSQQPSDNRGVPYQFPHAPAAPPQTTWDQKAQVTHLPPRPSMPMGVDRFSDGRSRGGWDGSQRARGERDRDLGGLNYG